MKIRRTLFDAPLIKVLDSASAGVMPGTIEAIVSVFSNVDHGSEVVKPGFFSASLMQKFPKGVWCHNWEIPVAKTLDARELMPGDPLLPDPIKTYGGLYIKGQFNMDTQRGKEAYSDLAFGTIDEFSIGYSVDEYSVDADKGIIYLEKGTTYEWSPVLAGMNQLTSLLSIKSADTPDYQALWQRAYDLAQDGASLDETIAVLKREAISPDVKVTPKYADYPLGDRGATWDASGADKRVREWAGVTDDPNPKYASAFFWNAGPAADTDNDDGVPDAFADYKLPYVDIVDGKPMAMPRAITAAAGVIQGARGGSTIPEGDLASIKAHIGRYYKKMADEYKDETIKPPWDTGKSAGSHSGLTLDQHADVAVYLVEDVVSRYKRRIEVRSKEGRTLSSANCNQLGAMRDSIRQHAQTMMDHADTIDSLLDTAKPKKADDLAAEGKAAHMRFLASQAAYLIGS